MHIEISKGDYAAMMSNIGKAVAIIKAKSPTTREYNVARQLGNISKKVKRKNANL